MFYLIESVFFWYAYIKNKIGINIVRGIIFMIDVRNFKIIETEKSDKGCKYRVSLELSMEKGWFEDIYFCVQKGNEILPFKLKHKMNKDGVGYFESEDDVFLETRAIYKYYFSYKCDGYRRFIKKEDILGPDGIMQEEMFKMSVNFKAPEWAKGRMMYHIFVDRFYRGSDDEMKEMPRRHIHKSWNEPIMVQGDEEGIWNNDFYGGDLKGITQKLDYIKSLGVKILYLSPIVYSQSTHRYDASDYEMVDPYAGTLDDLKELCDEAHKRGMKVVLDAVFNHTGSDSKYFNKYQNPEWNDGKGAFYDKDSEYRSFYRWYYNGATGKEEPAYWWGFDTLPVCNGESLEWQNYIVGEGGIIDQWFQCGIDGLRLDVADELTDDFIEKIRVAVHRNKPDGFILGEVWKNPMYMGRGYIEKGTGMDSVMNYNFIGALIRYFRYGEVDQLAQKIREIRNSYPTDTWHTAMNFTSTHDMTRGINLWDEKIFKRDGEWPWNLIDENHKVAQAYRMSPEQYEKAKEIYMAYVFSLAFMPGILSIFYGDEIGVQGVGNLDNRKPMPWDSPDQELLEFFKIVGAIRNAEEFMYEADLKVRDINVNYMAFERVSGDERAFVVVNRTPFEQAFVVPEEYQSSEQVYTLKKSRPGVVGPYGGVAMKIKS